VIMSGYGTIEKAVEAMKLGAFDFLPKPCGPDHVLLVVRKALERRRMRAENRYLREHLKEEYRMVPSEDPGMKKIMELAGQVAQSTTTVLISGESGTGKQLLARAIHAMSGRRDKPFVQVNCTTLSEQLLESDLFGHEKGAFTGAHQPKKGRVELADGGTLFLDEIGDLSPLIQAKLLHFLERGEFERVGGMKVWKVDARVLAATNRKLETEVKEGRFREDLFFRLNVVNFILPPLRERPGDIPLLADHFLKKFSSQMGRHIPVFSPEWKDAMRKYAWPGNIRELENAVERAVVLSSGQEIASDLLPPQLLQESGGGIEPGLPLDEAIRRFKRQYIRKILDSTEWNQSKASGILGIQRTYLSKLIHDLALK
ncbi:sigma-54-dependent Fis family transcriptional regulator, partial [bacterium]|nr:sigma-54-dependent Fis family transcriptional regulator [bacterium]